MSETKAMTVRCPEGVTQADGTRHTVVGCGSTRVEGPDHEGLWDCLDCGVWFDPDREEA